MERSKVIIDKFSPEFIDKYRLRPTTNAVLKSLIVGADPFKVIQSILTSYEDMAMDIANKEIIKAAHGPFPQLICVTQEAFDKLSADIEDKKLAAIKEAFPFEDETKPGRFWNGDNTDFRDL